jgi:hypothetical protein
MAKRTSIAASVLVAGSAMILLVFLRRPSSDLHIEKIRWEDRELYLMTFFVEGQADGEREGIRKLHRYDVFVRQESNPVNPAP